MKRLLLLIFLVLTPVPALAQSAQGPGSPPQTPVAPAPAAFRSDRILVEARGRGPDVVFIPGLGSTGDAWRATARRLEGRYRVHLVTVRGFGSVAPSANATGPLEAPAAREIRRYITEQRLNRPALVGHSMGGQIALRIAADDPARIGRVMVVDASPFFPSLIDERATPAQTEPLARLGYQTLMLFGDDALRSQAAQFGADLGAAGDALFRGLGLQGGDRRVLAQGFYEVLTVDLRHRLASISAPVTVVYGWSSDSRNPRHRVDSLFRAGFRNLRAPARFERIEGAEHQVMIEQPARFLAALERFLGG